VQFARNVPGNIRFSAVGILYTNRTVYITFITHSIFLTLSIHILFSPIIALVSLPSPRLVSIPLLNFCIYNLSRRKTARVFELSILDQLIIFLYFLLCHFTTSYSRIFTSNFACLYTSNCTYLTLFILALGAFVNYVMKLGFQLRNFTINTSRYIFSSTLEVNLTKPAQPYIPVNTLGFQRKLQENRPLLFITFQTKTLTLSRLTTYIYDVPHS
jgi:hypothetical protein